MRIGAFIPTMYPTPVNSVGSVNSVKSATAAQPYNPVVTRDTSIEAAKERFDTFERVADKRDSEPKPDFKAINLIKKSEIPPPEPPTTEELLEARAESIDGSIRNDVRFEIRGSVEELGTIVSEQSGISVDRREDIRNERIENTATAKTSDEIVKESVGTKLTPAQQKGIEVYQRVQSYASAMNISNVRMAG